MNTRDSRFPLMLRLAPLAILGSAPTLAYAHPGVVAGNGFGSGLAHPFGGLDHVCAMVAVGLWAAQRGGRSLWFVPLAFVSVMAVGGFLGIFAVSMPFVEQGIAASVLVLGLLIAAAARLPLVASALIVGLFALVHGHAHGTEMPSTTVGAAYGLWVLLATGVLQGLGIAMGLFAKRIRSPSLVRYAGGALAVCATCLLAV